MQAIESSRGATRLGNTFDSKRQTVKGIKDYPRGPPRPYNPTSCGRPRPRRRAYDAWDRGQTSGCTEAVREVHVDRGAMAEELHEQVLNHSFIPNEEREPRRRADIILDGRGE